MKYCKHYFSYGNAVSMADGGRPHACFMEEYGQGPRIRGKRARAFPRRARFVIFDEALWRTFRRLKASWAGNGRFRIAASSVSIGDLIQKIRQPECAGLVDDRGRCWKGGWKHAGGVSNWAVKSRGIIRGHLPVAVRFCVVPKRFPRTAWGSRKWRYRPFSVRFRWSNLWLDHGRAGGGCCCKMRARPLGWIRRRRSRNAGAPVSSASTHRMGHASKLRENLYQFNYEFVGVVC
jgi:hypothetical protein